MVIFNDAVEKSLGQSSGPVLPPSTKTTVLQSKTFKDSYGHPPIFVLRVLFQLVDLICDDDKDDKDEGDAKSGDFTKSVNLSALFRSSLQALNAKEPKSTSLPINVLREQYLTSLRSLCALVRWRENRKLLKTSAGFNVAKLLVKMIQELMIWLELVSESWSKQLSSIVECEYSQLTELEEDLEFISRSLVSAVQIVVMCCPRDPISSLSDFLPDQPWSSAHLHQIGLFGSGLMNADDASFIRSNINTASRYAEKVNASSVSGMKEKEDQRKLQQNTYNPASELITNFVDCGVLKLAIALLTRTHWIIGVYSQVQVSDRCRLSVFCFVKALTITQNEVIHLITTVLIGNSSLVSSLCDSEASDVIDLVLKQQPPDSMSQWDRTVDLLGVRKGLLCLHLNTFLSLEYRSKANTRSSKSLNASNSIVSLDAICDFFVWTIQRFDVITSCDDSWAACNEKGSVQVMLLLLILVCLIQNCSHYSTRFFTLGLC
jgi:hypothetical protein